MPKNSPSKFTMVPLRKSSEPTATRRARTIMGVAAVAALTGPLALVLSFSTMNRPVDFSQVDPQGRGIADAAAYQMASNEHVKIPTSNTFDPESVETPKDVQGPDAIQLPYPVDSVTWTGFERNTFSGNDKETTFEVHKYLLVPDVDEYVSKYEEEQSGGKKQAADDSASTDDSSTDEKEADVKTGNTSATSSASSSATAPASGSATDPSDGGGDATQSPSGSGTDESGDDQSDKDLSDPEDIIENGVTPYELEVPVVITDKGPRLAGSPSIAPWTDAQASPEGDSDYSNFGNLGVDANSQTARAVGRWAVAYAENDEDTLLDVTGDSNSSHRYVGLGGWKVADKNSSVQILQAISVNNGNQLLRVRVLLEDGRTEPKENENVYRMYADFDVLVSSPDSATPQVVSWGAAGSGASLTPYSTAVAK